MAYGLADIPGAIANGGADRRALVQAEVENTKRSAETPFTTVLAAFSAVCTTVVTAGTGRMTHIAGYVSAVLTAEVATLTTASPAR